MKDFRIITTVGGLTTRAGDCLDDFFSIVNISDCGCQYYYDSHSESCDEKVDLEYLIPCGEHIVEFKELVEKGNTVITSNIGAYER